MKLKIQYISDLHLERRIGYPRLKAVADSVLFLLGDIGHFDNPNYKQFLSYVAHNWNHVFMVAGNSEYQGCNIRLEYDEKLAEAIQGYPNIQYLNNKSSDFTFVKSAGIKIAGTTLWTDESEGVLRHRPNRLGCCHRTDSEWLDMELSSSKLPVLVLTHHLPSYHLISPTFSAGSVQQMYPHFWASHSDHLIRSPVKAWFCGHLHICRQTKLKGVDFCFNAKHNWDFGGEIVDSGIPTLKM